MVHKKYSNCLLKWKHEAKNQNSKSVHLSQLKTSIFFTYELKIFSQKNLQVERNILWLQKASLEMLKFVYTCQILSKKKFGSIVINVSINIYHALQAEIP